MDAIPKKYLGEVGDSKTHTLKCAPYHRNLSSFIHFVVRENVHPDFKATLLTIERVVTFYLSYLDLEYFWLHAEFCNGIVPSQTH